MGQVKFGLSNIHYSKYDQKGGTFATPKAWPGAVSFSTEYEGDTNVFYADNTAYYTSVNSSSITGSLEVADTPEEVRVDLLGDIKDETTGMLLEDMGATPSQFALMGEFSGDPDHRRWVFYNCKLSRPATEANTTEDAVEPGTDTLDFSANGMSMQVLGKTVNVSKAVVMSDAPNYETFFDAVPMPTATAPKGE